MGQPSTGDQRAVFFEGEVALTRDWRRAAPLCAWRSWWPAVRPPRGTARNRHPRPTARPGLRGALHGPQLVNPHAAPCPRTAVCAQARSGRDTLLRRLPADRPAPSARSRTLPRMAAGRTRRSPQRQPADPHPGGHVPPARRCSPSSGPKLPCLRVKAVETHRRGNLRRVGRCLHRHAPAHGEVHQRAAGLPDQRTGRPRRDVVLVLGDIRPPFQERGDEGRYSLRRRLLRVDVPAVVSMYRPYRSVKHRAAAASSAGRSPSHTARS